MKPRAERTGNRSRVSADLAGSPVWFESADVELVPSPEAFAGLALLPAATHGVRVRIEAPLSPLWLKQAPGVLAIHHEWWGTPAVFPLDAVAAGTASAPGSRSASLFSGGVDSFHVVLHAPFALDAIVFVQGIDMFLADDTRAKAYEPVFRQAANRLGLRAIFVRTNLREHAFFRSVPWERTHGAALAAVGHVLSGEFGRVVIPASSTLDDVGMWGSHWSTDGLWSSGAMTLVHYDPAIHRNEKLLQIAHEPVLWDALRVCWENRAPTGNCSACEKCVKTMVLLEAAGQRSNYTVFDRDVLLARRIRALRVLPPHMIHVWARLLDLDLSPEIKREIERLIARGRRRRWLPALRQRLRRVGFVAAGHAVRRRMRRSEDNHG